MNYLKKLTIMESCSGHVTVLSLGELASSRCFPYGLDIGLSVTRLVPDVHTWGGGGGGGGGFF